MYYEQTAKYTTGGGVLALDLCKLHTYRHGGCLCLANCLRLSVLTECSELHLHRQIKKGGHR